MMGCQSTECLSQSLVKLREHSYSILKYYDAAEECTNKYIKLQHSRKSRNRLTATGKHGKEKN